MDPVTHITAGALAASSLRGIAGAGLIFPLCLLAAWLPDIDQLFGSGAEDYLINHRGLTHSLLFAPLTAAVPALLALWPARKPSALRLYLISLGLVLVHIYQDWVTSYGTQLLAPLTDARYGLSSVFIIDPFLTLPALAAFFASLFMGVRGRRLAALGLAFMIAYPLAALGVKSVAHEMAPGLMSANGITYESYELTTDAFSPMYWKLIVRNGDDVGMAGLRVLPPGMFNMEWHQKADSGLLADLARQESFFAVWQWFAGYPVMDVRPLEDGGRRVVFRDLRFGIKSPPALRIVDGDRAPFSIVARIGPDGGLAGFEYNRPSGKDAQRVPN
jgi:inner membrane protein